MFFSVNNNQLKWPFQTEMEPTEQNKSLTDIRLRPSMVRVLVHRSDPRKNIQLGESKKLTKSRLQLFCFLFSPDSTSICSCASVLKIGSPRNWKYCWRRLSCAPTHSAVASKNLLRGEKSYFPTQFRRKLSHRADGKLSTSTCDEQKNSLFFVFCRDDVSSNAHQRESITLQANRSTLAEMIKSLTSRQALELSIGMEAIRSLGRIPFWVFSVTTRNRKR